MKMLNGDAAEVVLKLLKIAQQIIIKYLKLFFPEIWKNNFFVGVQMVILNEAKPKYEKLDELLEAYNQDIRLSNQVNIIIDVKGNYKEILSPRCLITDFFKEIIN